MKLSKVVSSAAFVVVVGVAAIAGGATSDAGNGVVYVVDTTSDPGLSACTAALNDCSLRGAITKANGDAVDTTINFDVPPGGVVTITVGSVDCDGDVDTVDALFVLRYVAGLSVNQPKGCPEIGSAGALFGDVDCDEDVDAVDALFILRHVAALPVNVPKGCTPIGDEL